MFKYTMIDEIVDDSKWRTPSFTSNSSHSTNRFRVVNSRLIVGLSLPGDGLARVVGRGGIKSNLSLLNSVQQEEIP